MKSEVFQYEWTYTDGHLDEEITRVSSFKVTREFVEERKEYNLLNARYRIIEETRESVDSSLVIEGKYHPELAPPSFQKDGK